MEHKECNTIHSSFRVCVSQYVSHKFRHSCLHAIFVIKVSA